MNTDLYQDAILLLAGGWSLLLSTALYSTDIWRAYPSEGVGLLFGKGMIVISGFSAFVCIFAILDILKQLAPREDRDSSETNGSNSNNEENGGPDPEKAELQNHLS